MGFFAFETYELLVNNASSATLAFSLRRVSFLPAADAPATRVGLAAGPAGLESWRTLRGTPASA